MPFETANADRGNSLEARGSVTAMTIYGGSGVAGIATAALPASEETRNHWSTASSKDAVNGVAIHYLSIKNPIVFGLGGQRVRNGRAQIIINSITVGVNGGAGGSYIDVDVVIHTTTHRTSSLTPYKATTNAALVWVDTTSTTATVLASSGVVVHSMRCPTGGNITESKRFTLEPGESISYIVTGSGTPKVRIGAAGYEIR